jgi:DNA-binding transcriptional LysR family regulator
VYQKQDNGSMQDLNDLYYFSKVVDHGGFAAAGRALGLPRSKLSRRIALLEERLGVRLIQRSTRLFSVTDIGQEYYRHCVAMLIEAEAAQESIDRSRAEPQGVVRISCPTALLYFQVAEMVANFMAACPKVEVHLVSTNRQVDVIREGFDFALRVRFPPLEESDLVMKVLAESGQCIAAAPALLEQLDRPRQPADLSTLPSLSWGSPLEPHEWRLAGPDGAEAIVRHSPRLVTEDLVAMRCAALRGVGIAQFPLIVVKQDLEAGRLVNVVPGWTPRPGIVHAIYPSRRGLLPSVRALLDHLGAEYTKLYDV